MADLIKFSYHPDIDDDEDVRLTHILSNDGSGHIDTLCGLTAFDGGEIKSKNIGKVSDCQNCIRQAKLIIAQASELKKLIPKSQKKQ